MNTAPKQKPPSTMCSYQAIGVMPSAWKISAITIPPANTEPMVFQDAIPVQRRIMAPMAMAMTDVSPIQSGMKPVMASQRLAVGVMF